MSSKADGFKTLDGAHAEYKQSNPTDKGLLTSKKSAKTSRAVIASFSINSVSSLDIDNDDVVRSEEQFYGDVVALVPGPVSVKCCETNNFHVSLSTTFPPVPEA